jgi:hypothetical protein
MVAKNQGFYGKFNKKWKIWNNILGCQSAVKCLFTAVLSGGLCRDRTGDLLIKR